MPEYLAPGVYVEEVDTGIKTIEGVSTSVAGFVGLTRRGRTTGLPQLVTSFNEFQRMFGGFADFGFGPQYNNMPYAVDGFFANGGRQLYVVRIDNGGATAKKATTGGAITRLQSGTTAPTAQKLLSVASRRGIAVGTKLRLRQDKNGIVHTSGDLTVSKIDPVTGQIEVGANIDSTPAGLGFYEPQYTTVLTNVETLDADGLPDALTNMTDPRPDSFVISAKNAGLWGSSVVVTATHQSGARAIVDHAASGGGADAVVVKVPSTKGFYVNAWVEIDRGNTKRYRRVKAVLPDQLVLFGTALAAGAFTPELVAPNDTTSVTVAEFKLTASFEGVTETFDGLTLENVPDKYYLTRINNHSTLIEVSAPPPPAGTHPFFFPSADDGAVITLTGGTDGAAAPASAAIIGGGAPGARTGIRALEDIDAISIIAAPGLTGQQVQNALIEQCERLKDRFAILDPEPPSANDAPTVVSVQNQRGRFDTKYAALYFPRLIMRNPLTDLDVPVPPSGHMAGIYARVDIERGVHKAPANEVVRDILGFETIINKETQDLLNPSPVNINVFRDFRADFRGLRIWGARCITSDTEWKYINVRRLFIFLEESLDQGTQWVVFEPNDERLWARVRQSISAFLTRVWRDGALMGTRAEEAFFVKCDRTTMTQDDLDNGRLIVLVGVAPVKPAEFVIIRIGQFTASAQNSES